jgi:hypothetical protein
MPRERSRRWRRIAIGVLAVVVVVLCVRPLFQPYRHTVYPIFAGAGRDWVAGADLYKTYSYRYSPPIAALFAPFGMLPDGIGGAIWRLVGAAVFLAGLATLLRSVAKPLLLAAPLALGNLHNGQANLLIIGLLLLTVAAVARSRFNMAALCLTIACLFKLYPIAVGLLLVLLYPRRLGLRLFLLLSMGVLLAFVLQGPSYVAAQYAGWAHHLTANDRQIGSPELWYRDARLLCSRWIVPMSYGAYQALQAVGAAVTAGAILAARRAAWPQARLLPLVIGLGCCWMTALGPATESATYVLLAPTAALLLLSGKAERHPIGLRVVWLTAYALLIASQAVTLLPGGWVRRVLALGPQPLAALLLLGGQLYLVLVVSLAGHKSRTIVRSGSSKLMASPS